MDDKRLDSLEELRERIFDSANGFVFNLVDIL